MPSLVELYAGRDTASKLKELNANFRLLAHLDAREFVKPVFNLIFEG